MVVEGGSGEGFQMCRPFQNGYMNTYEGGLIIFVGKKKYVFGNVL
jgi:hypothetical protein